jgi:hypothetical protein
MMPPVNKKKDYSSPRKSSNKVVIATKISYIAIQEKNIGKILILLKLSAPDIVHTLRSMLDARLDL